MKPIAFLWNIPNMPLDAKNPRYLYFYDPSDAATEIFKKDVIPLYTAHEIAEFIRGLYFDDNFRGVMRCADLADKIEEEAK